MLLLYILELRNFENSPLLSTNSLIKSYKINKWIKFKHNNVLGIPVRDGGHAKQNYALLVQVFQTMTPNFMI